MVSESNLKIKLYFKKPENEKKISKLISMKVINTKVILI